MSASALTAVTFAAQAHVVTPLPIPAWAYGLIALAVVLLLLVATWMFRRSAGVAIYGRARYEAEHRDHGATAPGAGHGHRDAGSSH